MEFAFCQGELKPQNEVGIGLTDAGFVWGAVVVDNCRTYRGELFRWPDHLARFRHDCSACFVPLESTDADLTASAHELIRRNANGRELQLITIATPGVTGENRPTLIQRTYAVPEERYRNYRDNGVSLVAASNPDQPHGSIAIPFISPTVKHRSRLAWWVAERANAIPDSIPVFFNSARQTYTETAIANLLIVEDGEVVSPPGELILNGISLQVVREICHSLGISFREGTVASLQDPSIQEIFLAGTGFGLAPIRSFQSSPREKRIDFTQAFPVLARIRKEWSVRNGFA